MSAPLGFIEPMECKETDNIPSGDAWQYELKLDGYRVIAVKDGGDMHLFSRNGKSFNAKFASLLNPLRSLRPKRFVIDGEIVALDENGRHSFSLLQRFGTTKAPLRFYVFDLLHLDKENLMALPLSERRERLEREFRALPMMIQLSPVLIGNAHDVLR